MVASSLLQPPPASSEAKGGFWKVQTAEEALDGKSGADVTIMVY